jgi:hypothetical protein
MSFPWLKPYLPRGLYGRAALILVAPAVVLQLIVSVHFIQNHLEDATRQMTDMMIRKLRPGLRTDADQHPTRGCGRGGDGADPAGVGMSWPSRRPTCRPGTAAGGTISPGVVTVISTAAEPARHAGGGRCGTTGVQ